MSPKLDTEVIIAGAGPVGLLVALNIAKEGIAVTVLEMHPEVIQSPRAMAYGPAAVVELERAGIAEDCREIGLDKKDREGREFDIRWIRTDGSIVAAMGRPKAQYPPVICGQHMVADVILKHLAKYPHAKTLWNHKVVDIKNNADSVTAVCDTPDGKVEITGKYLVGSDGARSTVRKLIGCTFDGFTYDKMVVATNVHYPFEENGYGFAQFIVDPNHFALVCNCTSGLTSRLRSARQADFGVVRTVKMLRCLTKKPVPTSKQNMRQCSPDPDP
jgi:2-polyprenyl-6-methoxyphenol hydroxylase-like FAD-dependent oxidoreductase